MKLTIRKIAELADVSKSTVSRALNDSKEINVETKKKIQEIIDKYGYEPNLNARNLARNETMTIALIIPQSLKYVFRNHFLTEVLLGIGDTASNMGYNLFFKFEKEFDYSKLFNNRKCDGIIFLMINYYDKGIEKLIKQKLPFLIIGSHYLNKKCNYIDSKDKLAFYCAVRYLYYLGHRKIAYIGGNTNFSSGIFRKRGYLLGLKHFSLTQNEKWIIQSKENLEVDGYRCMEKIISENELPTAVLSFNDLIAVGAMQKAQESGLEIPNDISIIGYDDIPVSNLVTPKLTTMKNIAYEKGVYATERLISMLKKKNFQPQKKLLPVELIERNSCKKI